MRKWRSEPPQKVLSLRCSCSLINGESLKVAILSLLAESGLREAATHPKMSSEEISVYRSSVWTKTKHPKMRCISSRIILIKFLPHLLLNIIMVTTSTTLRSHEVIIFLMLISVRYRMRNLWSQMGIIGHPQTKFLFLKSSFNDQYLQQGRPLNSSFCKFLHLALLSMLFNICSWITREEPPPQLLLWEIMWLINWILKERIATCPMCQVVDRGSLTYLPSY
jgi:hypothetical protein